MGPIDTPPELLFDNRGPVILKPSCEFQRDPADPEWIVCPRCGTRRKFLPVDRDPAKYIRTCGARRSEWKPAVEPLACVHRLDVLETLGCNVCGFKGQSFTIYRCEIYQRCMTKRYRNDRPDLKVCDRCQDYDPRPEPAPAS
jgi:hypothetical protein